MENSGDKGTLKIPGVEISLPSSLWSSLSFAVLCACITGCFAIFFIYARPQNIESITGVLGGGFRTLSYENQKISELHARKQFQFFTPSATSWVAKTNFYAYESMAKENREKFDRKFGWQRADEAKVETFGKAIIEKNFTKGWRRYPVEGQGRNRDSGWWWVITVDENIDIKEFIHFYVDYWGAKEIFIEEFRNFGDEMPTGEIPVPDAKTIL